MTATGIVADMAYCTITSVNRVILPVRIRSSSLSPAPWAT